MGTINLSIQRLLLFLSAALHWIRAFFSPDNRLHHARFAHPSELSQLLSPTPPPTGLLLGTTYRHFASVRPQPMRRELGNLLVVAPTRGGKGLLAVSQLLSWKHSVIINDIKGELFAATAGYRSTLGKVYAIDPTGVGDCYDPLHGKQTEDEFYSASSHLLFQANEGEGRIFTERATVMLTQLFLAAKAENLAPFPYVRFLIRLGLEDSASRLYNVDPQLATQFLDTNFLKANLTDRFLLSAWGTLTARMRPLLTETVIRSLKHADFTPVELLCTAKPVSIYIRWPEKDLLALSPLVRLLWGSLIDELITVYDKQQGKNCQPVLLLIDEAGRTAIPSLADHATTVVGRGISLWIAVQSLSQLETVYGKARAQVLRDNMESQIYYRPSNQETADYLEHCLGRISAYAHSTTIREGAETAQGLAEQGVPLMTAQDIKQLKDEETIGFHRQLPAFRLTRMDWRQHTTLQARARIPAPRLAKLPSISDMPIRNIEGRMQDLIDPDMILSSKEKTILDLSNKQPEEGNLN